MFNEMFSYTFMIRATVAILLISPLFGMVGTMIVQKRMAYFSDALGHSALTGPSRGRWSRSWRGGFPVGGRFTSRVMRVWTALSERFLKLNPVPRLRLRDTVSRFMQETIPVHRKRRPMRWTAISVHFTLTCRFTLSSAIRVGSAP